MYTRRFLYVQIILQIQLNSFFNKIVPGRGGRQSILDRFKTRFQNSYLYFVYSQNTLPHTFISRIKRISKFKIRKKQIAYLNSKINLNILGLLQISKQIKLRFILIYIPYKYIEPSSRQTPFHYNASELLHISILGDFCP